MTVECRNFVIYDVCSCVVDCFVFGGVLFWLCPKNRALHSHSSPIKDKELVIFLIYRYTKQLGDPEFILMLLLVSRGVWFSFFSQSMCDTQGKIIRKERERVSVTTWLERSNEAAWFSLSRLGCSAALPLSSPVIGLLINSFLTVTRIVAFVFGGVFLDRVVLSDSGF